MFSASEMIVIGVLALVLIGPKQLPEVARTLGRLIADLKRTANGFTADFKNEMNREISRNDPPAATPPEPAAPPKTEKFILRYEDGTPMRPEDREAGAAENVIANPAVDKKDEPS